MIVRAHDGQLILIRQLDHSALCGEFARRWGNQQFAPVDPLDAVALAAARHDEGWRDEDEKPLYDDQTRRPTNFRQVEVPLHVPFYAAGIDRIVAMDPYAGLLVSMHGSGIYQRRYGAGPVRMTTIRDDVKEIAEAFVTSQEALQAHLRRRLWDPSRRRSEFERQIWTHYEWLQVWDRLSLFVCTNDLGGPVNERIGPVPLARGGPDAEITVRADHSTVTLDPYPFAESPWSAAVPAQAIPDRDYVGPGDVRRVLQTAADATIRVRFART